jgi:hypothetical protein
MSADPTFYLVTRKIHKTRGSLPAIPTLTALGALSRPIRTPYSPVAARDAGPPARAREDTPRAGGATGDACVDVTRVYPGRCAPIFASARSRRSGASARFVASEERGMLGSREARCTGRVKSAEGAMHGQGQKRRRRDARAGSEAHLRIWSSTWSSTRC